MSDGRTTWRDIAADLRGAIERGDVRPGEQLPTQAQLIQQYGVASQTVANALSALRSEGLIRSRTGSGHFVRERPPILRSTRSRLSADERDAGRGAFLSDAHAGEWEPRSETEIRVEPASAAVAAALGLDEGAEVLVRDRRMFADDVPVQLATSYLPRTLTLGTRIEETDTGPGGIYARLEEAGHSPLRFEVAVRVGRAAAPESDRMDVPTGAPVFRITRVAMTDKRPVEVNFIVLDGERFELFYTV
ncbi:GntR family transcriptional regulator [Pseudonocardia sp. CA-107938]|uniref:GntR family transcriptional regulator n=1 Tax=Pseudonocardia sp. CA-107938 TaxID=3240021 RepID=UPI003D8F1F8F